jgi:hypothetical protein
MAGRYRKRALRYGPRRRCVGGSKTARLQDRNGQYFYHATRWPDLGTRSSANTGLGGASQCQECPEVSAEGQTARPARPARHRLRL